MIPQLEWWQWTIGATCAFMVGAAKTGLPGSAILVVPLMVLTVGDARQSAGWLLPILCVADCVAVYYWRRHSDDRKLVSMAPWVLVGMAGGGAALALEEQRLRPIVGVIIFAMLAIYLWRRGRSGTTVIPHPLIYGTAAGFASTVANAAGPVMNLYLLSMRLSKEQLVGTGAWFFFCVNLAKVPVYAAYGLIGAKSLMFDVFMVPAVLVGAVAGRTLLHRIPARLFEILVVSMTVFATLLLFR
jgi:uncharacterized membrane protein YfcA